jgi:hypothetical protein
MIAAKNRRRAAAHETGGHLQNADPQMRLQHGVVDVSDPNSRDAPSLPSPELRSASIAALRGSCEQERGILNGTRVIQRCIEGKRRVAIGR